MSRRKVSRNAPCPCGSGKKYKHCCIRKDFDWVEDDEGNIFKSMQLSDEMKDVLDEQRELFIEQHGREPDPDDPVFQDMPHLEHLEHQMIEIMKEAGIDPAIIHAAEKTGRLVTEENQRCLSDGELEEWNAAIEEYQAEQGSDEPPEYPIGTIARTRFASVPASVFHCASRYHSISTPVTTSAALTLRFCSCSS